MNRIESGIANLLLAYFESALARQFIVHTSHFILYKYVDSTRRIKKQRNAATA